MKRLASVIAFLAFPIVALVPSAQVFADSPGQLSNAATNYEVKNVTKNGSYSQSTSASCDDTVKYSVLLANSDFGLLKNLTVKTDLASGTVSASATNAANATTSVSGKVTVSIPAGSTLAYVAGSTVRITSDGKSTTNLPDGIVSGGVNAGELNGSTQTFVQFQAKVKCDTPKPPVDNDVTVCKIATGTVVTIKESEFNANKDKYTDKDSDKCKKITVCEISSKSVITISKDQYNAHSNLYTDQNSDVCKVTELPETGLGQSALGLAGLGALTYAGYAYIASRRA